VVKGLPIRDVVGYKDTPKSDVVRYKDTTIRVVHNKAYIQQKYRWKGKKTYIGVVTYNTKAGLAPLVGRAWLDQCRRSGTVATPTSASSWVGFPESPRMERDGRESEADSRCSLWAVGTLPTAWKRFVGRVRPSGHGTGGIAQINLDSRGGRGDSGKPTQQPQPAKQPGFRVHSKGRQNARSGSLPRTATHMEVMTV